MSPANSPTKMFSTSNHWLVVSTPPKNISQLGWFFPIYGKIKNVPNHQPEIIYLQYRSLTVHRDLQAAVVRCFKKELGVHTAGHKKTKRKLSRGDHDFHHFPPHKMHFLVYQPPFLDKINLHCIPAVSKFGGCIISSCLPLYLKKQISLNISHIGDVWPTKKRLQVARFLGCIDLEDSHLPLKFLAHMLHVWHITGWWFNPSEKY